MCGRDGFTLSPVRGSQVLLDGQVVPPRRAMPSRLSNAAAAKKSHLPDVAVAAAVVGRVCTWPRRGASATHFSNN